MLLAVGVVVLVALGLCGQAVAAGPWWHVAVLSAPAAPNSTQERVDLLIANVGDVATEGTLAGNIAEGLKGESKHFVTIMDTLPAGVTPVGVHAEGGGTFFGLNGEFRIEESLKRSLCSIEGQVVRCQYATPVRAYEQVMVGITVEAQPGAGSGTDEVSVSGGGALAVRARHALGLERGGSYGVQSYELTPEEEGGLPSTQAGAHPFQLTTTLLLNSQTEVVDKGGSLPAYLEVEPLALGKDLRFNLPPDLIGNPTPLPMCSLAVFLESASATAKDAPQCPDSTVVGVAAPIVTNVHLLGRVTYAPLTVLSPLFSLEPSIGEPARFGFNTPRGPVILDTSVRTGSDYGVVVTSCRTRRSSVTY
jgi:hypothetical protein